MSKTIKEIAKELNCSIYTIYAALYSGKLKGTNAGRSWNVTDEAIEEYKENRVPRGVAHTYTLHKGDRFGEWTVVDPKFVTWETGARMVLCRCSCGKERLVDQYKLMHGYSRSCGCKRNKNITATIIKKQTTKDVDREKAIYVKGYKDAQLAILRAYCKNHDVFSLPELQDVAQFIGLSADEIKKQLIADYDKEKQDVYDKASKEAKNTEELIHLLWKNGFVLEDFEKYGFSADTVWNTVMEEK